MGTIGKFRNGNQNTFTFKKGVSMSYQVPATAEERIAALNAQVEEFKTEYAILTEKQKKVSAHRARKALLNIAKLTRVIRKDIQEYAAKLVKKDKDDSAA